MIMLSVDSPALVSYKILDRGCKTPSARPGTPLSDCFQASALEPTAQTPASPPLPFTTLDTVQEMDEVDDSPYRQTWDKGPTGKTLRLTKSYSELGTVREYELGLSEAGDSTTGDTS